VAEHIEECLTCLAFPEAHRRRIRTTNGLERFNQEIKRRTRECEYSSRFPGTRRGPLAFSNKPPLSVLC
jgi:transposase-like protein